LQLLIFKTKWIILKIHKVDEKDYLYTIFTFDYWKILCQKKINKKEKTLDLWYVINFEIETKETRKVHKIRNIKISSEFQTENKNFTLIHQYLELLWIVLRNTPDGVPVSHVLEILEYIHSDHRLSEERILLAKLKCYNTFWILKIEHKNQTIQKILKFIDKNNITEILKLTGINTELKKELEQLL